jgi:hypothetical protein
MHGDIREMLIQVAPEDIMWIAVAVTGAIIVVCFLIALVVVVISIHVEDNRANAQGAGAESRPQRLPESGESGACVSVVPPRPSKDHSGRRRRPMTLARAVPKGDHRGLMSGA